MTETRFQGLQQDHGCNIVAEELPAKGASWATTTTTTGTTTGLDVT